MKKKVTLNQFIGAKTYLEIRKYLLDLSKLTFGGIILSGIMGGMTDTLTLILIANLTVLGISIMVFNFFIWCSIYKDRAPYFDLE